MLDPVPDNVPNVLRDLQFQIATRKSKNTGEQGSNTHHLHMAALPNDERFVPFFSKAILLISRVLPRTKHSYVVQAGTNKHPHPYVGLHRRCGFPLTSPPHAYMKKQHAAQRILGPWSLFCCQSMGHMFFTNNQGSSGNRINTSHDQHMLIGKANHYLSIKL